MRALLLVLLLINLVFFAWSQGWMAGAGLGPVTQREPQRLALQIHPEQVQITPLASSSVMPASAPQTAPSAPAEPLSPASSDSAPAPAPVSAPQTAAADTGPTVCRQIGPFGAMEASALAQAQAALAKAGLEAETRNTPVPEQWMVLLGPFPSQEAMRTALDQISQQGKVKVFAPVTDRPRYEPGISLGVFSNEASAQEQLQMVKKQGVQGARVVQRNAGLNRVTLRLPALTSQQVKALSGVSGQLGGQIVKTCATEAAAP
ncbi:SPOR domain-containing protein [Thiomonas bhubaneswarensis]|uniref:Sporulation related domain n=1 Tax=Thiomonas bhubaneswarensis TaxID=339866 RepID=A0A0K6HYS4_9BURK|nr:SPOR domain-containing protein [Thiomonas bhubaneswarensis]CUA95973.1 Sporulation related domain [Thiomonas bhubaneswarensis]